MLCEEHEAEISRNNLAAVLARADGPVCLLGGWAVHLAVNSRYGLARGRDYLGSKDVDLGFHLPRDGDPESVRRSPLARSIGVLEGIGFRMVGSRLVKHYHRESRRALSDEEARKVPMHDMFSMYVDPMVDNVPDGARAALGFSPLDEAMLAEVFEGGRYDEIDEFGARIMLPKPDVLLSTKLVALPRRTKDHKRHKDIADVYALIWYSGTGVAAMRSAVLGRLPRADVEGALLGIGDAEYAEVSDALGIDADEIRRVVSGFLDRGGGAPAGGGAGGGGGGGWPMPFGVSYGTFVRIPTALLRQGAGSGPIPRERLAGLTSIGARNIRGNMGFLEAVGVVERAGPRSYALTPLGVAYAGALASGDGEAVRSATLDVIRGSHLGSLSEMLDAAGGPDPAEIYAWIKAKGGHPDGSGSWGMHQPTATGAKTLLRMFEDAGLVPGGTAGGRSRSAWPEPVAEKGGQKRGTGSKARAAFEDDYGWRSRWDESAARSRKRAGRRGRISRPWAGCP